MILGLPEEEFFAPGHGACAGCGAALAMRYALKAAGKNTIVVQATGCMEVVSTAYPLTAWKLPYIHAAFENAAAVASGVSRALKKLGKDKEIKVLAIGGDGGTFDIGLQALSGAAERGENICYLCYDNGAYANTGMQRSGATPLYAATTTSPAGKKIHGKTETKKPLPLIMAAHGCYVATANIAYPQDFVAKVKKALAFKGTGYVQVYSPCPPGWKHESGETIKISKLAFETKAYPMFEIENGLVKLKKVENPKPIKEYLKLQGRFKHLNEAETAKVQQWADEEYEKLKKLEEAGVRI